LALRAAADRLYPRQLAGHRLFQRYRRRGILVAAIAADLLCLGVFKYLGFFAEIAGLDVARLALPLGISFPAPARASSSSSPSGSADIIRAQPFVAWSSASTGAGAATGNSSSPIRFPSGSMPRARSTMPPG
jgi:hypothetical protein